MSESLIDLEIVLHTDYGGFCLNDEMALWLVENRGWVIRKNAEYNYKEKNNWPFLHLIDDDFDGIISSPHMDDLKFRSHPDLVSCVKALKELHKNDTYAQRCLIHRLTIVKLSVFAEIERYNDGHERINCQTIS